MLDVVDAEGNSGGVPPFFLSVTRMSVLVKVYAFCAFSNANLTAANPDDSCIPSRPTAELSISTNVTHAETCQPVGFHVEGGTKPYNVTLAALSSPIVINATLGPDDDLFTFINRADPHMVFLGESCIGDLV